MTPHSTFLKTLAERGFLNQCTDQSGLDEYAQTNKIVAYIGFDCTADSLHVGNLISIMMLRHLQQTGHKPIVLLGGGTSKVGDPSFKDEARKMLSLEQIEHNKQGIKKVFEKFLTFGDGPNDAIMVDNADWLDHLNYMAFLRDYGIHFSVNRMLSFDSVKMRLEREQNLSFLEFNYMILQAYDFAELNKRYNCVLQMGGQDQWGNIVNGTDLTRRVNHKHVFGLTSPLLTMSDGTKMGKTERGAVWLNADKLSPYDYWQFWRNASDADVGTLLRFYTELPISEIAQLEKLEGNQLNEAKIILANEATTLCHGIDAARHSFETAKKVFEEGGAGGDLPSLEISMNDLEKGLSFIEALKQIGFVESNGEAKRLIKGRGARVNNNVIDDEAYHLSTKDLIDGSIKVSAGKKHHGVIVVKN
ncbi:MAG: tyrosine--tRNA ligase [Alphaproteobacteria bacterium]|nr:tyrosine--tRNA ligase [Alphaproteobacteria bacterium]